MEKKNLSNSFKLINILIIFIMYAIIYIPMIIFWSLGEPANHEGQFIVLHVICGAYLVFTGVFKILFLMIYFHIKKYVTNKKLLFILIPLILIPIITDIIFAVIFNAYALLDVLFITASDRFPMNTFYSILALPMILLASYIVYLIIKLFRKNKKVVTPLNSKQILTNILLSFIICAIIITSKTIIVSNLEFEIFLDILTLYFLIIPTFYIFTTMFIISSIRLFLYIKSKKYTIVKIIITLGIVITNLIVIANLIYSHILLVFTPDNQTLGSTDYSFLDYTVLIVSFIPIVFITFEKILMLFKAKTLEISDNTIKEEVAAVS